MGSGAGRERRRRAVALLPWAAAGLALFMLGRLFPLRAEVTHSSARQLPSVRTVDLTAADRGSRPSIAAFVGVQTGFTAPNPPRKYNYELRRQQLRKTWFPGTPGALKKLEREHGVVARFVAGHSEDGGQEARMQAEADRHGDFLRLDLTEAYLGLARKSLAFFTAIAARYDVQYVIKVDDDVFLRLDRVPAVVAQWRSLGADYIGCMKTGGIQTNPRMRWYEPQHVLLGSKSYFAHTWGSIYVLSGEAAALLTAIQPSKLRYLGNEDVTVGSWMLALNVSHYDDRRMCEPSCSEASVAVYDFPKCAGLCNSVDSLPWLWGQEACRGAPLEPPLRPQSWRFP